MQSSPHSRVAAGDDLAAHDKVAVFLYWLTAVLMLSQFAFAADEP